MCGICGKLNFNREEFVDRQLLGLMTSMLYHRGPDGAGVYSSQCIGLGHRRLSIIDLKAGAQPMCNEDANIWLVYNGEIYNFRELRSELELCGHKFKSATDTEVIIHLYEELGERSVDRLRGMFSYALWDERKKLLLLARDRIGIKPLYYTNTGKSLLFGSEIKSLIADPSVERRVNLRSIDRFLTYHYLPGNETFIEGILKLDPGCYLTCHDGKLSIRRYWDLHFDSSVGPQGFPEATEMLGDLLSRTVKDHMISDVPVGVLLSGGVDSTGILRYAVENANKKLHTFTIGFSGAEFADERPYARLAAQRFGTEHQDITMTAQDFRDFLPKYVLHMEEPICEPPAVALYYVANLAQKSSVKVLLSGEGGDEAFGGYQNYRNLLLLEHLKSFLGPAKRLLAFGLNMLDRSGFRRIGRYAELVDLPQCEYYLSRTTTPNSGLNELKTKIYSDDFRAMLGELDSTDPTTSLFRRLDGMHLLNRMLYVDTRSWLPDDLLVKADKMTMATSVELRVPLLDFRVLEFAASLPPSFKVRGWQTKRILKSLLAESVPHEILERKKTGLPVPYSQWLRTDLKKFTFDIIGSPNSSLKPYFSNDPLRELLNENKGSSSWPQKVFALLVLELLLSTFLHSGIVPIYKS